MLQEIPDPIICDATFNYVTEHCLIAAFHDSVWSAHFLDERNILIYVSVTTDGPRLFAANAMSYLQTCLSAAQVRSSLYSVSYRLFDYLQP